jgi:hypothetical protein
MPIGTRSDATKVMMGASLCPADECSVESVPGAINAGLAVRRNSSTGAYQVSSSSAGPIVGLSMGRSLGKSGCFSLCYNAPKAVLRIGAYVPTVGAQVHIDNTTGQGVASGGGATATAAIYEKVLVGGGVDEITGDAVNVAIINLTAGF